MSYTRVSIRGAFFCTFACILIGCADTRPVQTPTLAAPNYSRPLPAGDSALRLVTDPLRLPDLIGAAQGIDAGLVEAIDESLVWFAAPSSRRHYPFEGITHQQALAGVLAMRELVTADLDPQRFREEVMLRYDIYESVGYDGSGTVLFTGAAVAKLPLGIVTKAMMPFFVALFVVLLMVTYVPAVSLWLPRAMGL